MSASPTTDVPYIPGPSVLPEELALAALAFRGSQPGSLATQTKHLAWLPADSLDLDLSDPSQRQFGDYKLMEKLGEGGMGVVYRAQQLGLDREVAIKVLSAGPWAAPDFVRRFRAEAQSAARMQHPNIVPIYEIGVHDELVFYSMRLVRGPNLAQWVAKHGPRDPRQAAMDLRTIAEAVHYAHQLGVLHLDLKPDNILIDERGWPQVADFGLARRLDHTLSAEIEEISGTPSYMAPEQATAGKRLLTPATDIYGLGAVFYEMLTGAPPFRDADPFETLKQVRERAPRAPRNIRSEIPRDLEAICLKCLAKSADQRYASARELAEDLMRYLDRRPVLARPLSAPTRLWRAARREPKLATALAVALLALIGGLIASSVQWQRAENNAITSKERLWESRRQTALRMQLDGKGFEALPGLLSNIEEQQRTRQSVPANIERREIGAILSQGVTLIDRLILADAKPLAAELSPDGSLLAVGLSDETVRWFDTRTLIERGRVDISDLPTSDGEIREPRLLRFVDNRRLRVTLEWYSYIVNPADDDTYLLDLDRGRVIEPPTEFADLVSANYSASGRFALLHDRHRQAQLWQVEPWRPVSVLVSETPAHGIEARFWMLGPNARLLASLDRDMTGLQLYDARNLARSRHVALPVQTTIHAWAESGDGTTLALGDANGRVFVLDLATLHLRQLPTPLGREVNWLAFSEDDVWLAAVRQDGAAFAFSVASGDQLTSNQMQHDFVLTQVSLSHRERMLVASGSGEAGKGQVVVWRLPISGLAGEATRLLSTPTPSAANGVDAAIGLNGVGASLDVGLLATATWNGEIRLWRLPPSPLLAARAAEQISGNLYFDSAHLPDVEYSKLRVTSTNGTASTPWVELPQPVGFAELLDGGRTLVATSGTELRVFETATLKLRYPPVKLPNTPQHLVAGSDGANIVLGFGGNGDSGFEVHLETFDLKTGKRRPNEAVVKGPLYQLEVSADATRLLARGPPDGTTEVFDTGTLKRLGRYKHDPDLPAVWAAFSAGSGPDREQLLIAATKKDNASVGAEYVMRWDPNRGALGGRRLLYGNQPIGVIAVLGKPFVASFDQDVLDPDTQNERRPERLSHSESTATLAVSNDSRLVAHAFRREVRLYDATTAEEVGPPLRAGISTADVIVQIAFAPDDHQLLGRTLHGHWLLWPIAADFRSLAEMKDDAVLLGRVSGRRQVLQVPSPAERERLHERDPGAWTAPEPRPIPGSVRDVAGAPIPARDPHASPLMLDLTAVHTLAPETVASTISHTIGTMRGMPIGVLRLDGIDYDVRGEVELRSRRSGEQEGANEDSPPTRARNIHVPQIPIAAFHVLMLAFRDTPQPVVATYADIRLHYRDGGSAVLPILTQRDVPGWTGADLPTPFAWAIGDRHRLLGDLHQGMISSPRLANPHPERLVTTLELETADDTSAEPVFFAVTAEPVIAGADLGSKSYEVQPKSN